MFAMGPCSCGVLLDIGSRAVIFLFATLSVITETQQFEAAPAAVEPKRSLLGRGNHQFTDRSMGSQTFNTNALGATYGLQKETWCSINVQPGFSVSLHVLVKKPKNTDVLVIVLFRSVALS
jgi:hypothetical protein